MGLQIWIRGEDKSLFEDISETPLKTFATHVPTERD